MSKALGSFIIILCLCSQYSLKVLEDRQIFFCYMEYATLCRCNRCKHITVEWDSSSLYYNCTGFFHLILLVICDTKHTLTLIAIGSNGSNSDCEILGKSVIGKKFYDNKMNLLFAKDLASFSINLLNCYMVGNKIFSLKSWLLRLYPSNLTDCQKVFNCQLSRLWCTIKNIFGVLSSCWQIFHCQIKAKVENTRKYSLSVIALPNYLQQEYSTYYCPTGFIDSENSSGSLKEVMWRDILWSEDS